MHKPVWRCIGRNIDRPTDRHIISLKMNTIFSTFDFIQTGRCVLSQTGNKSRLLQYVLVAGSFFFVDEKWSRDIHTFTNYKNLLQRCAHVVKKNVKIHFTLFVIQAWVGFSWFRVSSRIACALQPHCFSFKSQNGIALCQPDFSRFC